MYELQLGMGTVGEKERERDILYLVKCINKILYIKILCRFRDSSSSFAGRLGWVGFTKSFLKKQNEILI